MNRCTSELKNLCVHDNVITQPVGAAGIDASTHRDRVWSSWDNRFTSNNYDLSNGAEFRWEGNCLTHDQWTATGLN